MDRFKHSFSTDIVQKNAKKIKYRGLSHDRIETKNKPMSVKRNKVGLAEFTILIE